MLYNTIG